MVNKKSTWQERKLAKFAPASARCPWPKVAAFGLKLLYVAPGHIHKYIYMYMYVFTYLGITQAMSVSKVPWGQREFWDRRPEFGLIGLLSRRKWEQQEFLLHGHWLIMFFFISTRIYDFLALRTTECRYCCRYYLPRFFFFSILMTCERQQWKRLFFCESMRQSLFGDDCCFTFGNWELINFYIRFSLSISVY